MKADDVIGIYGGGRMGAGIAHAFLLTGTSVTVVETDTAAADAARDRIGRTLRAAVKRGSLSGSLEEVESRLTMTTDVGDLAPASLVVEAVPEDIPLKQRVLAAAETAAPKAALATNTSSLSIDAIADGLADPSNLVGLHFFNPVPASDLVEIVVGRRTPDHLTTRAERWVDELGKTAIVVADSPGFASSRLGVAIALEAMRMLEEGVASAADIDAAMHLGYRHPVGPLRTTDIVGLDVRLAVSEHLAREVSPRFEPPQILRDLVAAGHVGRKAGRGFFNWEI